MTKIMSKIIFLGTPEFAVPILEKLINSGYKPAAVFCAPDKPVGRKQVLTPPPVKVVAQKYDIPVYQPENKDELAKQLSALKPDLVISAAFGLILPKAALDAPRFGCLNVHPSLLPKYRGASPIQAAILNGDEKTGVTIYKMDEQIDHGAIISQQSYSLSGVEGSKKYTTPKLSEELSGLGADLLIETLPNWLAGKIAPTPQDDSQASFTKTLKKEDGHINWQKSAKEIEQQIRAYTPWPGSHTFYSSSKAEGRVEKLKLRILDAGATEKNYGREPGKIYLTDDGDLAIQTGSNVLIVKKLQLEGGKAMTEKDFLQGHKDIIGKILK